MPCLGGLVLASTMMLTIACESGVNHPAAPSASPGEALAGASEQTIVSLCHATAGVSEFVPISVPPAAVDAHIAHGDGRVGHPVPGQPGMKFGADCTPAAFVRATITFRDLSGHGSPFTSYTESGLTVLSTTGNWQVSTTYGNPAPFIQFVRPAGAPTTVAEVKVTAAGAAFSFSSVDLYSSVTPIPYVFTGLLNSTVFTVEGTQPNTFGRFATVLNPHPTAIIDTLVIRLSNPATPCCSNPTGLDNIVVVH